MPNVAVVVVSALRAFLLLPLCSRGAMSTAVTHEYASKCLACSARSCCSEVDDELLGAVTDEKLPDGAGSGPCIATLNCPCASVPPCEVKCMSWAGLVLPGRGGAHRTNGNSEPSFDDSMMTGVRDGELEARVLSFPSCGLSINGGGTSSCRGTAADGFVLDDASGFVAALAVLLVLLDAALDFLVVVAPVMLSLDFDRLLVVLPAPSLVRRTCASAALKALDFFGFCTVIIEAVSIGATVCASVTTATCCTGVTTGAGTSAT